MGTAIVAYLRNLTRLQEIVCPIIAKMFSVNNRVKSRKSLCLQGA